MSGNNDDAQQPVGQINPAYQQQQRSTRSNFQGGFFSLLAEVQAERGFGAVRRGFPSVPVVSVGILNEKAQLKNSMIALSKEIERSAGADDDERKVHFQELDKFFEKHAPKGDLQEMNPEDAKIAQSIAYCKQSINISFGDQECVICMDPITHETKFVGKQCWHTMCKLCVVKSALGGRQLPEGQTAAFPVDGVARCGFTRACTSTIYSDKAWFELNEEARANIVPRDLRIEYTAEQHMMSLVLNGNVAIVECPGHAGQEIVLKCNLEKEDGKPGPPAGGEFPFFKYTPSKCDPPFVEKPAAYFADALGDKAAVGWVRPKTIATPLKIEQIAGAKMRIVVAQGRGNKNSLGLFVPDDYAATIEGLLDAKAAEAAEEASLPRYQGRKGPNTPGASSSTTNVSGEASSSEDETPLGKRKKRNK